MVQEKEVIKWEAERETDGNRAKEAGNSCKSTMSEQLFLTHTWFSS